MPPVRRPRHPLLRALSLLLGLAVVAVLMMFGLAVAGVMIVGGGLWLGWQRWQQARSPQARTPHAAASHQPEVLEGEFVVISQGRPAAH